MRFQSIWLLALLLGIGMSEPLRGLLEQNMVVHMFVQWPLLIAWGVTCQWVLQPLGRYVDPYLSWNLFGVAGMLFILFNTSIWMIPRALDLAVMNTPIDLLKCASFVVSGLLLRPSWKLAPTILKVFWVGNTVWMLLAVGYVFVTAPTRLCNSYLADQQLISGYMLMVFACALLTGSLLYPSK